MKTSLLLLALLAGSLCAAEKPARKPIVDPPREELEKLGGFEPAPPDPEIFNIHVEMQVVAIPEADALPLIDEMKDPEQIERTYGLIQQLIAKRKATLVGWPLLITRSGQRAVVENVQQIRYATEFERPAQAFQAAAGPVPGVPEPNAGKPDEAARPAAAAARNPPPGGIPAHAPDIFPTAFESRDAGVTLEVEPTLNTQTMEIDFQMLPQHVRLLRFEQRVTETDGRKTVVEQPLFETNKLSTNITLRSGQRVLLGTFRVSEPAGCIELFIFKATAKPVQEPSPRRPDARNRAR